jgi:hypothetical protein
MRSAHRQEPIWARLDKLRKLRNVAEHFALPANPKQMNSPCPEAAISWGTSAKKTQ